MMVTMASMRYARAIRRPFKYTVTVTPTHPIRDCAHPGYAYFEMAELGANDNRWA